MALQIHFPVLLFSPFLSVLKIWTDFILCHVVSFQCTTLRLFHFQRDAVLGQSNIPLFGHDSNRSLSLGGIGLHSYFHLYRLQQILQCDYRKCSTSPFTASLPTIQGPKQSFWMKEQFIFPFSYLSCRIGYSLAIVLLTLYLDQ